jgi:AcrR family transcriptional regulator
MSTGMSLVDRHTDATQRLILTTAVELLERSSSVSELTVRAVAKHAGMSERTVFRYYASRDDFLDAVAAEVVRNLQTPAPPPRLEELPDYPRVLYARFEEKAGLVRSALHTEVFKRIRETVASERWHAVRALIDAHAGHRSERDRKIAAANIRYYLAATTWHYYRFYFGFTLDEAIDCARSAVRLAIDDIVKGA